MSPGLNPGNPVLVAAFRSALLHQGLLALVILAVLGAGVIALRRRGSGGGRLPAVPGGAGEPGGAAVPGTTAVPGGAGGPAAQSAPAGPEPPGRLMLLIGFGNLWLFDGLLQLQPGMPAGLPSQGIDPGAAASPAWVQHVVSWGVTSWSYHPVPAAAAAVWIQVGLGIWLLAAPAGALSRLAGLASAGWGLVVWVFGESFGGSFAPGLSWLSGAPGAAALYVAAGVLIALPGRAWPGRRLGRLTLAGLGLLLSGMALLQAWPGRGFWAGTAHGHLGSLSGMALTMAVTPQPGFLSGWVAGFAALDEAHGFAVNLLVVLVLAATGAAFLSGRPWLIRPVLAGFTVLCLAVWVLVQDLGFLGGVGTDPNSMIPFVLLATAGYLAVARRPRGAAPVPARAGLAPAVPGAPAEPAVSAALTAPVAPAVPAAAFSALRPAPRALAGLAQAGLKALGPRALAGLARAGLKALGRRARDASTRSLVAAAAAGLVLLGAAPLVLARTTATTGPVLPHPVAGAWAPGGQPPLPPARPPQRP
jgi:hypothetical protein